MNPAIWLLGISITVAMFLGTVVSASELSSMNEPAPGNQEEMKSDEQAPQPAQQSSPSDPGTGSGSTESQSDRSSASGENQPPFTGDQPQTGN